MFRLSRSVALVLSIVLTSGLTADVFAAWPPNNLRVSPNTVSRNAVASVPDGSGGVIIAYEESYRGTTDIFAQRIGGDGSQPWGYTGIQLCTATGSQHFPAIVSDGAGGAIVTWEDHRGSSGDIYAQRISGGGSVQWATDGVAVCIAAANQTFPSVASDGAGGAIICWSDGRAGNFDVYARRITVAGALQWTADGVALCTAAGNQLNPSVLAVASGTIVVWQDARAGATNDIYCQLVNLAGAPQWAANGVAVCTAADNQDVPLMVSDGSNGAIVTWRDHRSGTGDDVYARRVTQIGVPVWTADGNAICVATGDQSPPRLVADGVGGAVIAWGDGRAGAFDIYAQRVDNFGNAQWTADGTIVCAATGDQTNPVLAQDGSGGAIIAWSDGRVGGGAYDLYAARITGAAARPWTADGIAVCTAGGNPLSPRIVVDGFGGVILAWGDTRSGTTDVYARRVDSSGLPQWTADGVQLSIQNSDEVRQTIVPDGAGGAIVVWEERYLSSDIYAQRFDGNGNLLWTSTGVAVCTAANEQFYPAACADGAGGIIVAWGDFRASATTSLDIYVQHLNASGTPQWTANGVALCAASGQQNYPAIVPDGLGGAIVAWEDYRGGTSEQDIYARRISSAGVPQWTVDGVALCTATGHQSALAIETDGANGAIAAWVDERGANKDVYARRVNSAGTVLWTLNGNALCTATGDQELARLVADGGGGVIAVWRDARIASNSAIYAQRLNGTGAAQWTLNGIGVCTVAGYHDTPAIITDLAGGAIVAWSDGRGGSNINDIYAQRLNAAGAPQWTADGVAVCTAAGSQWRVALVADGSGGGIATWEDGRFGNLLGTAIYARGFNGSGTPAGPASGVLVAPALPTYKQIPTLVSDGSGGAIVTWWDTRNSTIYDTDFDVYAQRITTAGALSAPVDSRLDRLSLGAAPNPAFGDITLDFRTATTGRVSLMIFDVQGRRVRGLVDGLRSAGPGRVRWDGRDDAGRPAAGGVYLCRLDAPGEVRTVKLVRAR